MGILTDKSSVLNRPMLWLIHGLFFLAVRIFNIKRLDESADLAVIAHPRSCYTFHALALPRRAEADFLSFDANRLVIFAESLERSLIRVFTANGLDSMALIVNGGSRQTFPLFHAHLISTDGLGDWNAAERFRTISGALVSARERVITRGSTGYSIQLLVREKADILLRIRYD